MFDIEPNSNEWEEMAVEFKKRDAEIDRLKKELEDARSGKPSWEDAPEWANWLAQDKSGLWAWFEDEPYIGDRCHISRSKMKYVGPRNIDWKHTLEERPEAK